MIHELTKPFFLRAALFGLTLFLAHSIVVSIKLSAQEVMPPQQSQQEHEEIQLWPNGLPAGSVELDADTIAKLRKREADDSKGHKFYVDSPTLTAYRAAEESANGCAVVICPGGGYNVLAWEKEGLELAEWFNTIGVSAFVLQYRVPRRIPDNIHWEPMQDVQRSIRVVRHEAQQYEIDPERIGVLGFSAGGHLSIMAGTHYDLSLIHI